jgi:hypothetical protein
MMETIFKSVLFPDRDRFKKVEVVAVYIEPRVDSGERTCVGVVALQEGAVKYAEVTNLKRLRCLYGAAHTGLVYAGQLALKSLSEHILRCGFEAALQSWTAPAQGLFLGKPISTASSSLDDALQVSLSQFSSLYTEPQESDTDEPTEDDVRTASATGWRLERLVKETTVLLRPDFATRFGQKRRIKESARPMRLGFVGEKIVANFGLLTHKSLSAMVNNSKAKLWDLAQARGGTQAGWFDTGASSARFELFVQRSTVDDFLYTLKQKADIAEALEELETEADKLEVRCRSVDSPVEIARELVAAEA